MSFFWTRTPTLGRAEQLNICQVFQNVSAGAEVVPSAYGYSDSGGGGLKLVAMALSNGPKLFIQCWAILGGNDSAGPCSGWSTWGVDRSRGAEPLAVGATPSWVGVELEPAGVPLIIAVPSS